MGRETREQQAFDTMVEDYEAHLSFHRSPARRKIERMTDGFVKYCGLNSDSKLLEIGCGSGFMTRVLVRKKISSLIGIDVSLEMLKAARRTSSSEHARFVQADCNCLPFGKDSFDAIVGHGILHHLDINCVFVELMRVLKSGGKISFYEPNMLNPMVFVLFRLARPGYFSPDEMALYKWQVKAALERHDFQEVIVKPMEIMLNQTPARLVPLMEAASRFFNRIPVLREFGGSLLIEGTLQK